MGAFWGWFVVNVFGLPTAENAFQALVFQLCFGSFLTSAFRQLQFAADRLLLLPRYAAARRPSPNAAAATTWQPQRVSPPIVAGLLLPLAGVVPLVLLVLVATSSHFQSAGPESSGAIDILHVRMAVGAVLGQCIMGLALVVPAILVAGRVSLDAAGNHTYRRPQDAPPLWAKLSLTSQWFRTGVDVETKVDTLAALRLARRACTHADAPKKLHTSHSESALSELSRRLSETVAELDTVVFVPTASGCTAVAPGTVVPTGAGDATVTSSDNSSVAVPSASIDGRLAGWVQRPVRHAAALLILSMLPTLIMLVPSFFDSCSLHGAPASGPIDCGNPGLRVASLNGGVASLFVLCGLFYLRVRSLTVRLPRDVPVPLADEGTAPTLHSTLASAVQMANVAAVSARVLTAAMVLRGEAAPHLRRIVSAACAYEAAHERAARDCGSPLCEVRQAHAASAYLWLRIHLAVYAADAAEGVMLVPPAHALRFLGAHPKLAEWTEGLDCLRTAVRLLTERDPSARGFNLSTSRHVVQTVFNRFATTRDNTAAPAPVAADAASGLMDGRSPNFAPSDSPTIAMHLLSLLLAELGGSRRAQLPDVAEAVAYMIRRNRMRSALLLHGAASARPDAGVLGCAAEVPTSASAAAAVPNLAPDGAAMLRAAQGSRVLFSEFFAAWAEWVLLHQATATSRQGLCRHPCFSATAMGLGPLVLQDDPLAGSDAAGPSTNGDVAVAMARWAGGDIDVEAQPATGEDIYDSYMEWNPQALAPSTDADGDTSVAPLKSLIGAYQGKVKRTPQSEVPQIDDWPLPCCSLAFHLAPSASPAAATTDEHDMAAAAVGVLPQLLSTAVCSSEVAAAQVGRSMKIRSAIQGVLAFIGLLLLMLPFVNSMVLLSRFIGPDTLMAGFFGFNAPTLGEGILPLEFAALVGGRPLLKPHVQSRAHGFYNVFIDLVTSASAKTPQTTAAALSSAIFGCAVRTCAGIATVMLIFNAQRMPDSFYSAGALPTEQSVSSPLVFPFVTVVGAMVAIQVVIALLFGCVFTRGRITIALVWIFLLFVFFMGANQ